MATKHSQVTSYYFSFDEYEINAIILALRSNGETVLADDIYDEINGGDENAGVSMDWSF